MTNHAHRTKERASNVRHQAAEPKTYELQADAIKALAHPKRLMIVDLLSDGSERIVTDLVQETGLSQSNVSQNLAILRAAGIVSARRDGNHVYYHLTDPRLLKAVSLLRAVMETQLEDKHFLVERAKLQKQERAKRSATYSILLGIGLLAAAFIGAMAHPLMVGGDITDMATMAVYMAQSPGLEAMVDTCMSVSNQMPTGAPPVSALM